MAPMSRDGMITDPEEAVSIIHLSNVDGQFKRKSVVTYGTILDLERRQNEKLSKSV